MRPSGTKVFNCIEPRAEIPLTNSKRNQYYQYSDCRCMERKKLRKMAVRLSLLGFNQIVPAGTVKAW